MEHTVFIGIIDSAMVDPVIRNLHRTKYQVYIGDRVNSFSELVNNCIKMCDTDIFIFCSHRVSPTDNDIERLVHLLNSGYGYVGLYRFACFGIHMDVINKIGGFDENFIRGGYEDDDYRIRLQCRNIAFYEDHSVEYRAGVSTWANENINVNIFNKKYKIDNNSKTIYILTEDTNSIDTSMYLPFNKSVHVDSCCIYSYYNYGSYTCCISSTKTREDSVAILVPESTQSLKRFPFCTGEAAGIDHKDIILSIVRTTNCISYLELGIFIGHTFNEVCRYVPNAIGVDLYDVRYDKSVGKVICMATDDYFKQNNQTFDIIFIDADHKYESVVKDLENSLKVLNKHGIIFLHDTDPMSHEYTVPSHCGDSYKIINYLYEKHPELDVVTLPVTEAGLTIVKRKNETRVSSEYL
jgi:hypothetical protein